MNQLSKNTNNAVSVFNEHISKTNNHIEADNENPQKHEKHSCGNTCSKKCKYVNAIERSGSAEINS